MKILKNGFTLIEIFVVIIITGIMISIAIPAYEDYNNRSDTINIDK
jgi:prepilin-type N-terminal cleavage/methylation domain-containing protein